MTLTRRDALTASAAALLAGLHRPDFTQAAPFDTVQRLGRQRSCCDTRVR